jgi:hypothetical protein
LPGDDGNVGGVSFVSNGSGISAPFDVVPLPPEIVVEPEVWKPSFAETHSSAFRRVLPDVWIS